MMDLVGEALLTHARDTDARQVVKGYRMLRFRKLILSGGEFSMDILPGKKNPASEFHFEMTWQGKLVCDGLIVAPLSSGSSSAEAGYGRTRAEALPLDIEALIPHRDRMRLVDEVVEVDPDACTTQSVVRESWPFHCQGRVRSLALVESVAQTASALFGWKEGREGVPESQEMIVGIRRACWSAPNIPVGAVIQTTVDSIQTKKSYAQFKGTVASGSETIAEVEMQAVRLSGDALEALEMNN